MPQASHVLLTGTQEIEELANGFGGERGPAEVPVWWQEPTNEANGLTRDRQGRMVACEHLARRVTR